MRPRVCSDTQFPAATSSITQSEGILHDPLLDSVPGVLNAALIETVAAILSNQAVIALASSQMCRYSYQWIAGPRFRRPRQAAKAVQEWSECHRR